MKTQRMKPKKINVAVITLGCAKNIVDSENLLGLLKANDINTTENIDNADTLIINTCGFIAPAKEESINSILGACQLKRRGKIKKIIVTGCLAERYAIDLREQIKDVDYFFGLNSFAKIINALKPNLKVCLLGERQLIKPKHYAYLKISEGCDHSCSFCAIPNIRGRYISRPIEEIVSEAELLAAKDVKELILIAQDTTYYGRDLYGKPAIAELLDKLSARTDFRWIRLMYGYPNQFPLELLNVIAERENVCNYIDLPLQHISTKILKSMKRGITKEQIEKLIAQIREKVPNVAIRSTFIVGYPGETEKDFIELLDFVKSYRLSRVGVFTYSHEDGTSAYKLKDNIPENIKQERRNALMEAQLEISLSDNINKIDTSIVVLIDEQKKDNIYMGRTENDAPDVDNGVYVKSSKKLVPGDFVKIKIYDAKEYDLYGE